MKLFGRECQDKDDVVESFVVIDEFTFAIRYDKVDRLGYSSWIPLIYQKNKRFSLGEYPTRSEAITILETFVKGLQLCKL